MEVHRRCDQAEFLVRRNSFGDPHNKYNANRVLRLINTSRDVQGLPSIELRAFTIWLNKTRKRYSNQTAVPAFQPGQALVQPRELKTRYKKVQRTVGAG